MLALNPPGRHARPSKLQHSITIMASPETLFDRPSVQ
jgi:hypothetical protein